MPNTLSGAGVPNAEAGSLRPDQATPATTAEAEVSNVEADERVRETLAETRDDVLHAEQTEQAGPEQAVETSTTAATTSAVSAKDEVTIEVEKVLEDGLGPFYSSLPPEAKPLFKQKGEQASREISEMIRSMKINVKRILKLIHDWLKTIPGVNKFFLEQEAKIKTDRIVELAEARNEDAMNHTG